MTRRIYSIAPHARFLDILAERVLDGTLIGDWPQSGPFWLADITIILPTRRARLALADAFVRRGQILLPDIRTFGGETADEEPFLPPFDASALPPAVSALERRLTLARLVGAWAATPSGQAAFADRPGPAEILSLAESLGDLLDDLAAEGRSAADLERIVPDELAENWQQTLAFLKIALDHWPEVLAERGKADTFVLRNERLARQAQTAPLMFGERPVIAAGSTGSIPATAALLAAVESLPRGALVLPGFDTSLGERDHAALLDERRNPHGHPQYGLAKLLRRLDAGIGDVVELAGEPNVPRTVMVRHTLALTETTALWADNRLPPQALSEATQGMSIIAARTEDEEARAVALAARDGLERRKSVGIVTPDQILARRIAAELRRFGVTVDDAAGEPLFHSPAGRLVRQILALIESDFAPVDLMALLRNPSARLSMERAGVGRLAERIDLGLLRGRRPRPGIAGLLALLEAEDVRLDADAKTDAAALFARLEDACSRLRTLAEQTRTDASAFAHALIAAFDAVAGTDADLPGATELRQWADELVRHVGEGPEFAPRDLDGVLFALMRGVEVRNAIPRRADIAIWGQLEARLQSPDIMILASLNEDKWPEPADPGPWLSRGMRLAAGLEPPERKTGLAAHDFEMALGNHDVILAFSQRLGTSPAVASRLVQRLEAFVGADCAAMLHTRGGQWLDLARRLDAAGRTRPAPIPAPNPPVELRPRKLSVTEIETLMRSPYDIYAKHVLRLSEVDRLGEDPGPRERGTLIHKIFGDFVAEGHDPAAPDALETLERMAADAFAGLEAIADRRDIWLRRFHRAAAQFIDFERARKEQIAQRHAEVRGQWTLAHAEPFTLAGRADRIDVMADGTLEIIDFKTGGVPEPVDMRTFDAPQLLLEAAMSGAGAMEGIAPAHASALTYIKVSLGPEAFLPREFALAEGWTLEGAADEAVRRMNRHVDEFLYGATPMAAQIRPVENQRYAGAYDHLARVAEWSLAQGDDVI
ncbi:double-strand break repair protein AddB [Devosia nitrariae]|uniref:Double-strand break repair protein AddB n=1 Tax=Devosia nitrariae TaxID=2071872 RepID=A0ABQ5W872_9HYPH|nr:double-strand break repair protein AddB [Devosia nitrariae]GLQ56029.1 double-strand break repair protein AddB [Devosia nitrariae]